MLGMPLSKLSARQYLFSRSTIATWCPFFTVTLRKIKELAVSNDTQPASIMKLSTAFFTLNCLVDELFKRADSQHGSIAVFETPLSSFVEPRVHCGA
jgi:hypothetical protein